MSEMTTEPTEELTHLKVRVQKLALDKSYLQLIIKLINKVSASQGLENLIEALLNNILDNIGGANIILYYKIDDDMYYADLLEKRAKLERIDDELVKKALESGKSIEQEHDFGDTRMLAPELSKAYTWVFPLVAGNEQIGAIKLESLHLAMRELYSELPIFFTYVATILKNEIYSHTQLKQAYDHLSEMNRELVLEVEEREQAEEELRHTRDELEEQVAARTAELQSANVLLQQELTERLQMADQLESQRTHQEELILQRTGELQERGRELQYNQQALMNIVEDLNLKTEELEQANARLLELDRLKSMFIASMSHELRTPLNSIIGFSSIIRDEWLGPVNQEQKENLDTIQRSGKHLLSLINDVIDVSKIEAGRIETRFEEFDLYDLITEAIQYVERDIHDKGLELHLEIAHHILGSDKRRLLQCVINLLSNAVKFTEHGGISVSAGVVVITPDSGEQRPSGTASPLINISVEDSGIGIAKDDIPRLFKAFERLESPMKTTVPGTGLGLYLTRKLVVNVLGGDILCSSKPGMGSTFSLRFPERIYEKGSGCRG